MSKLNNMRGIEIHKFRAVSSGLKTLNELFGDNGFQIWADQHRHLLTEHMYEPTAFLWHEDENITWDNGSNIFILAINDNVTEADVAPYEIIEFPGGIFLVATGDENDNADLEETISCMMAWIKDSDVFEYGDFPKSGMCNMPNPDGAFDKALGIAQQQIYQPLKFRHKQVN
jgi:hypothetical protein